MKKLIVTASAALCAAVGLCEVSSSVVGYLNQSLTPGVKTVNGTPFLVIGDNQEFNIKQIIPMDGDDVVSDGGIELSWYDYAKGGFRFVTWYDDLYDSADDSELGRAGWAEDKDNQYPPADEATLNFTTGDWFFLTPASGTTAPKLNVAGQLFTSDATKATTSLTMTPGVKLRAANPLPVATKITDIVPMDGDDVVSDGGVEFSWYDYAKGGFRFLTWYDDLYDPADDSELGRAGWAEDKDNQYPPADEATLEFEAGRGFFVTPASGTTAPWVAFPNPFYKE